MPNIRNIILHLYGEKIRNIMSSFSMPISFGKINYDSIKKLALYTDEIMQDNQIKSEYENQLKISESDYNLIKIKLDTFSMIRNVIIHFSIFDSWEDIYLTPDMLTWNTSYSSIKKYFDNYHGQTIKYIIYMRDNDGTWIPKHTLNCTIPQLDNNKKTYLKDFMSIEDVFWTFCLIDSLLEYLNIDVITFSHYSI